MNRPTALYYIPAPIFEKKELDKQENYLRQVNPTNEYLAMRPQFSKDFSQLTYIGRDEKFLSHSGTYQLKMISWPLDSSEELKVH